MIGSMCQHLCNTCEESDSWATVKQMAVQQVWLSDSAAGFNKRIPTETSEAEIIKLIHEYLSGRNASVYGWGIINDGEWGKVLGF